MFRALHNRVTLALHNRVTLVGSDLILGNSSIISQSAEFRAILDSGKIRNV